MTIEVRRLGLPASKAAAAAGRLDALLAERLADASSSQPVGRRLGLEHEYAVLRDGRQIDFRDVIHEAGVAGARLHPTNPDLYFTPSGLALMADGVVAEVASPPQRLRPGFTAGIEAWAAAGRAQLDNVAPAPLDLIPGSTHLSVEVDTTYNDELCRLFTQTFAPGLMLLMDNQDSPGMLVRPRPHRAELCGEYVDGPRLRAAAAYATGAVIALERRLAGKASKSYMPQVVDVVVEPGRQRYGWYIDRHAFGPDLYHDGRRARLRCASGSITAQQQLEAGWQIAREALHGSATSSDLAASDDVIAGRIPLPSELRDLPAVPAAPLAPESSFAGLSPLRRGSLTIEPAAATWDFVAFKLEDGPRQAVINVPEAQLLRFTRLARTGSLDDLFESYLAVAPAGRSLTSYRQAAAPAFFDSVVPSASLLPPDRFGIGSGPTSPSRPGKVFLPPPVTTRAGFRWWPILPLILILVGIGGGVALTQAGGYESAIAQPTAVAQPPATQPVALPATQPPAVSLNVGPIVAQLQTPVTVYSVTATGAPGRTLTYAWTMTADPGEECGVKLPAGFTTAAANRTSVTWSHANTAPDNCRHDAPDHPFTITVTVSDGVNPAVSRTYRGSNTGVGPSP